MKFDESGKPTFVDPKDKAHFDGLLSLISSKYGRNAVFEIEIRLHKDKDITNKQIGLFKQLCSIVSDYSGQNISEVESALIQNHFGKKVDLSLLSKEEFHNLFENSLSFCQSFFGLAITYNETFNRLEKIQ